MTVKSTATRALTGKVVVTSVWVNVSKMARNGNYDYDTNAICIQQNGLEWISTWTRTRA